MKRDIRTFLVTATLGLAIVPAANLALGRIPLAPVKPTRDLLFNIDAVKHWLSPHLVGLGVSISPKQTVIGRQGWMFLGDEHAATLSTDRRPATDADRVLAARIGAGMRGWAAYFAAHDVRMFRVMLGPNKGSVHPESMPAWARPVAGNPTDALLAAVPPGLYVDLRPVLRSARLEHGEPLYYRTDTHWNMLGGGLAFRAFARDVGKAAPDLRWPDDAAYALKRVQPRPGGDLARFLRVEDTVTDIEPVPFFAEGAPAVTVTHFDTGLPAADAGGNPAIAAPSTPLRVQSPNALNARRVLWLRDSYGTAMAPLMAATFTDVVQVHWNAVLGREDRLARLVEAYRPDYVFITVVERAARDPAFAAAPR